MVERVEALVLQVSADIRKLEKGMAKARETTSKELTAIEKKAGQSAKQLEDLAGKISGGFEDLARGIPVVGDAIAGLGPAAIIAGGAFGALGIAAKAVFDGAEAARKSIDDLATSAENIGTSAESAQALRALGIELDVTFETIEKGLNKLQVGAAEAASGTGALYNALKKTQPELLQVIGSAQTQEDRWDALSKAISGTDDQLEKVAIAKAAFGKEGAKFVRLLDGEDKTIANLTNKYRALGVVLEEDLVAAVGAADQRMQLAQARMDANATRANAAWIPAVEAFSTAWADLNVNLGTFFDTMFSAQADQQFQTLVSRLGDLNKQIDDLETGANQGGLNRILFGDIKETGRDQVAALSRQKEMLELDLEIRKLRLNKGKTGGGEIDDPAEETRKSQELSKLAAERDRQRQGAAVILASLGDVTELVKIKEGEYNELVKAGFLTRTQATAALEEYRKSLVKVQQKAAELTAGEKLWQDTLKASETPIDRARAALGEFWDAVSAGTIGPPAQAQELLRMLTKNLQDAENAARSATPEFIAIAAARKAIADADAEGLTLADRLSQERRRLNGLVGSDFSQDEADRAFQVFTKGQTDALRDDTREAVKAGLRQGLVTDDWGTALREIVATNLTEGLNDTINRLADILSDFILGRPGESGTGFLDAALKFISGGFGGARAGGGSVMGGKSYLVGEKGPELLRLGPGQSGQVLNASQLNALSAGTGGPTIVQDNRISIGGVDMVTYPVLQNALNAQSHAIAARVPGAVNATLASNRRQKRRF